MPEKLADVLTMGLPNCCNSFLQKSISGMRMPILPSAAVRALGRLQAFGYIIVVGCLLSLSKEGTMSGMLSTYSFTCSRLEHSISMLLFMSRCFIEYIFSMA